MTPADLIPDAERVLAAWLRAQPEVAALVAERVYTAFPRRATPDPLVLVRRFGGEPPIPSPLVLDLANVQADAYGGNKAQAWELAATVRWVCATRARGTTSGPTVLVRAVRFLPDESFNPPRPRYVCDLDLYIRPADARWTADTRPADARQATDARHAAA